MVSTTKVNGDKPNRQIAWINKPKSKNKNLNFAGAANLLSFIKRSLSQAGQIISIVESAQSYIGNNGYLAWAKCIRHMERKDQDNFIPATVKRRTYGTVISGQVIWNADNLDTEDKYNRDLKIWERKVTAGTKQWKDYVDDSGYLFPHHPRSSGTVSLGSSQR